MKDNLSGRLKNTNLPKSNSVFALFEAVVNSINSIDERIEKDKNFTIEDSYIKIAMIRSSQLNMDDEPRELIGFDIIDNGIGFIDDNYESFSTLDSPYKAAKGCRGVGRLLWLKAFSSVHVNSTYAENGMYYNRSFEFSIQKEVHNENKIELKNKATIETTISLINIEEIYKKSFPKTKEKLSRSLIEHCLWYYLRNGGAPKISIIDDGEELSLDNEFENYAFTSTTTETFDIKGKKFDITHVKLKSISANKNVVFYSAANRLVKTESLTNEIPGLFGALKENDEDFYYICFVSSEFLTENVSPERMSFNISEDIEEMFKMTEISFKEIREQVVICVAKYLEEYLTTNKELGQKKVLDFVTEKAPRYKSILNRIPEKEIIVDPSTSDKDLELKLHKQLMIVEEELISEGHDLLRPEVMENEDEYSKKMMDYLSKASDLKQSDLANYIAHRKVIIDFLNSALRKKTNGKYVKEDIIHNLLLPMQNNSTEFENDTNLWLIDERLSFHNFLASDKTLKSMPITESDSTKEPDILALNIYDNPLLVNEGDQLPLASITVVEIKRPMRDDFKHGVEEKDPIKQALGYLERIRKGRVKTEAGRQIPNSESIPGYCYILGDMTDSMIECCKGSNLQVTSDKLGYFGYNSNYNAYIEVLSFDRLLSGAKQRNRAFFDKLGLPTT